MKKQATLETASHTLSVDQLRDLIAQQAPPCVSIYLPTRRGGGGDDRQRYEGRLREAAELLGGSMKPAEVREFLAPLEAIGDAFWQEQQDGLAIFHSRERTSAWALPAAVPELTVVSNSFHIRPLLRFLQANSHYYLLTLSQNHVGFFRGDAGGLRGWRVSDLPRSLAEVTNGDETANASSVRTSGPAGGIAVHYRAGNEDNVRDEELAHWMRAVDKALWPVLRDEKAPLILASIARNHPAFHAITRYPHLAAEGLHGNFEKSTPEDLHARAWPIVVQQLESRDAEVSARFQRLYSSGRANEDLTQIARFALQGRVHELLLARDVRLWGTLDPESAKLELHGEQKNARDDDVLDDLAEAVLVRGGSVLALSKERMPVRGPVAAILRW